VEAKSPNPTVSGPTGTIGSNKGLSSKRLERTAATWIAYLLLIYFSLILNCLGPITSFVRSEQHLTFGQAGLLGSSFAAGFVAASLVAARISRKLGPWGTLSLACAGLLSGSLLICSGKDYFVLLAGSFFAGTLGSLLISEIPLLLVREHHAQSRAAITEANGLASASTIFAPAMLSLAEQGHCGWRAAFLAPFLLVVACAFIFLRYRPTPGPLGTPALPSLDRKLGTAFWTIWLLLLLSVAVEFSIIFWATDFFRLTGISDPARAGGVLIAFFVAMSFGRLLGSALASRFSSASVITVSLCVAFVGSILYCFAATVPVRLVGLASVGLGISNLYPSFLTLALSKSNQIEASAKTMLASGIAILLFPFVLGGVADLTSLRQAQILIPCILIAIFAIFLRSAVKEKRSSRTGSIGASMTGS
jgi:MFS family permease